MTFQDILLQQIINGLSLGAMYSLLALGFTMVYGIIELINFAHFNVFMVGSFFALWVLEATALIGQRTTLAGFSLAGVLLLTSSVPGRFSEARHLAALPGSFSASITTSPVSSSATRPACAVSRGRCWAGSATLLAR